MQDTERSFVRVADLDVVSIAQREPAGCGDRSPSGNSGRSAAPARRGRPAYRPRPDMPARFSLAAGLARALITMLFSPALVGRVHGELLFC
jgi:hypothetical protein